MLQEDICWGEAEAFENAWAEGINKDVSCWEEAEEDVDRGLVV